MPETDMPPSEADRPLSAIHSPPSLERTSLPALLTPGSSGDAGRTAAATVGEDGSATFLKVRVQVNSSPEKNAVSGKEGNTLIVDAELLDILANVSIAGIACFVGSRRCC